MAATSDPILSKCLEFCQTLTTNGLDFSISIKIGTDFSFSMESKERMTAEQKDVEVIRVKKVSPSTKRRSEKRLRDFIAKKKSSSGNSSSDSVRVESLLPPAEVKDVFASSIVNEDSSNVESSDGHNNESELVLEPRTITLGDCQDQKDMSKEVDSPFSSYVPKKRDIRRRCNEKGQPIFVSDRPVFRCKVCKVTFQVDDYADESDMIETMDNHTCTSIPPYLFR